MKILVSPINLFLFLLLGLSITNISAQTSLSLGDVAFVDYQSEASTSPSRNIHFSFISFKDLSIGTTITFTDKGWHTDGFTTAGANEGILVWTATSLISAGQVISLTDNGSGVWSADIGSVNETEDGFYLDNPNGDQILVYQVTVPTIANQSSFITGIDVNGGWTTSGAWSFNKSRKPTVFTDGVNSISLSNKQNVQLNYATASIYLDDLKDQIFLSSNWLTNNTASSLPYDYSQPNGGATQNFGSNYFPNGPGGIGSANGHSSLELWLIGDKGFVGGTSATWADQSGNGLSAVRAGSDPDVGATYNSYSSVNLDGNDWLTAAIPSNTTNVASVALAAKFTNYSTDQYAGVISGTNGVVNTNDRDWNGTGHVVFMKRYNNSNDMAAKRSSQYGARATNTLNTTSTNVYQSILNGTTTHKMRGNGTVYTATNAVWSANLNINKLTIGKRDDEVAFSAGDFMEFAYYSSALNTTESVILDNYLSAKYGNTLASNDIYDGDNIGYDYDVAGIGRVNGSDFHADAQGTGSVRIRNPIGLGNNEYLLWGHNLKDGKTRNVINLPTGIEARLERVWNVSEVGDVGAIDISFDLSGYGVIRTSDLRLIVHNSSDFSTGTAVLVSGASLVSGSIYSFSGVSALTNDCFFTIGSVDASQTPLILQAPGGVFTNLEFWMKGNTGFTDKSGKDVSISAFGDVNTTTDFKNYNPVISFDGNGDYLTTGLKLNPLNTDFSAFHLFNFPEPTLLTQNLYSQQNGIGLGRTLLSRQPNNILSSFLSGINSISFDTISYNDYLIYGQTSNTNGVISDMNYFRNGLLDGNFTVIPEAANGSWIIGTSKALNSNFFEGQIGESIVYSQELNSSNRSKVESYLAVKYSIPTTGNLYASNGIQYWTNPGLTDFVAIGRDDASGLLQKQSRSKSDSVKIFVDNLAGTNSGNLGSIQNDISFIVISSTRLDSLIIGDKNNSRMPAGLYSMFNQTWEITNYNFDDEFSIEIEWDSTGDFDINDIRMVIDTDSDLSDGTIIDNTYGVTFSIGSIIISGISTAVLPKNSSAFFSIGSVNAATPLPIELLSFSVDKNENEVNIHWKTTNEINNDFFTIEKSSDGKRWEQFGKVEGAGTSHKVLDYHFVDAHPYAPLTYYRLKQTNLDGTYSYSRQIAVSFEKARTPSVYPNPSHGDYIYLDLVNYLEVAKIEVIDMLGRNLEYKIKKEGDEDTVHLYFDKKLKSGQFLVKVEYLDGSYYRLKFVSF